MSQTDLASALQRHFGFPSFRPGQGEALQSLREGRHTLVVMPTGAGKSLVFQLGALLREGLTLVVSPLIALMKDQVDALERRGIAATYINSALPVSEQNARLQRLAQGAYRLVYVAPERLRSVPFLNALQGQKIGLLAVDEAHCISEWGHDFRPDYLHLAEARRRLGNPLTVALTATATPQVQDDIIRLLELGEARRIVTGFNRPNLYFEVRSASGPDPKLRALSELFSSPQTGAAIVYTGTRRDAEEVTLFLQQVMHLHAGFYHAGLPAEERERIQNEFIAGRLNVICATNAFGMGIDRADVRQVIHYSLPGSLEAYYQEAGRAGRDGQPAQAILLYDPQDRALQEFFIANSALNEAHLRALYQAIPAGREVWLTADELCRRTDLNPVQIRVGLAALERAEALQHLGDEGLRMLYRKGEWLPNAIAQAIAHNRAHLQHRYRQLEGIVGYAESNACRRRVILQHFGDTGAAEASRCCDNCLQTATRPEVSKEVGEMTPGERAVLIVLDCVRRARVPVGREKLAQILHGSKAQDIRRFHHDRNPYYGKLAAVRQADIEAVITQLIEKGYLKMRGSKYPVLVLTPRGEQAIAQKEAIALRLPKSFAPETVQRAKGKLQAGGTVAYTAKLLAEGLSVEEIAQRRGLAVSTIYGHCAQLIERGLLEVERVIPAEVQAQIQAAIQRAGVVNSLSDIKALLPETIGYDMIRCVLASRRKIFAPSKAEQRDGRNDAEIDRAILDCVRSLPAQLPRSGVAKLLVGSLSRRVEAYRSHPLYNVLKGESRSRVIERVDKLLENGQLQQAENGYLILGKAPTHPVAPPADPVAAFLSSPHPRPLKGLWQVGFALDFHSSFRGADWERSAIGELVYRLKYEEDRSVLPLLVEHTRALFAAHPQMTEFDVIVPVPPSTPRPFQPLEAYCQALAQAVGKPVKNCLVKTRPTRPQKEMSTLAQKRANVAGAFTVQGEMTGERILLVDDLYDSGATLEEITRLLLRHGARQVNVLTWTRTIHVDA
jgi:ATP-dependent DNA helicase RecQ